jgi:DNA-binding beta-propeller fold protein YncE
MTLRVAPRCAAAVVLWLALLSAGCSDMLTAALQNKIEHEEHSIPVPGSGGALTIQEIRAGAVALRWQAATDADLASEKLEYRLYSSQSDNIRTPDQASANGVPAIGWTANCTNATASSLLLVTPYYFNVLVRDLAGNVAAYACASATTLNDTLAPLPGGSGALTVSGTAQQSVTLSWLAGSDNVTPQESLQYLAYYSLANNIDTVHNTEANGVPFGGWSAGITSKQVTGLTDNTQYYFNVLIQDEVGLKSACTSTGAVTVRGSRVYWTDGVTLKVQRARLDASGGIQDLYTSSNIPFGLAVDPVNGKVYWTEFSASFKGICRMSVNGGAVETLISSGATRPRGIALDVANSRMYWTDDLTNKIYSAPFSVSNADATSYAIVTGLNTPHGIALDLVNGKIYWAESGAALIRRSNLDGSSIETVQDALMFSPYGIALSSTYIYWTDWKTPAEIRRAPLGIRGVSAVLINTNTGNPADLALDEAGNALYWTDLTTNNIYKSPLFPPGQDAASYTFITGLSDPAGIDLELR